MAKFGNEVYIGDTSNYAQPSGLVQLGMFNCEAQSYSGAYYHFKTNLVLNTFVMSQVTAIGHAYAKSALIHCTWNWYSYDASLVNTGMQNIYTGMTGNSIYMSGDGRVCFSGYISTPGDVFFTLNTTHACPAGGRLSSKNTNLVTNFFSRECLLMRINRPLSVGSAPGNQHWSKYCIHHFNTTEAGAYYLHFKTNMPTSSSKIATIEALGYNYGTSQPVRCAWGFYGSGGVAYDRGKETAANSGLTAHGIYASSDGYVCIRGYTSQIYFIGFILNSYTGSAYTFDVSILASTFNVNAGNHY